MNTLINILKVLESMEARWYEALFVLLKSTPPSLKECNSVSLSRGSVSLPYSEVSLPEGALFLSKVQYLFQNVKSLFQEIHVHYPLKEKRYPLTERDMSTSPVAYQRAFIVYM